MIESTEKSYNEIPYHSYPYAQSSPEKLAALATLFGMSPPKVETARVLELGCAEGGNIIPHAVHHPKGKYVGVDLSEVQVKAGLEHIKNLGLKNIELKHCSITDIDDSYGKFDYIICHGVFSWVPKFVQEKILDVCGKYLTDNGVAYISYNTLPGWNMVRAIRDMMLYHAQGFENPQEKVTQARALLNFVKDSLGEADTPYAKVMRQEAELLSKQGDHYIRHEHLEDNNIQMYFSDFIKMAQGAGLQYLSDCSLATMYLGNMKKSVVDKLQGINDIVRIEQYMDFINNRRFRSTLLCKQGVKLNRALNNEDIKKFAISINIRPEKPRSNVDIESGETLNFYLSTDKSQFISTASPALKAALYVLAENIGYSLKFDTIVDKANTLFDKANKKEQIAAELLQNAMNLVVKGYMQIALFEKDKQQLNLDKPIISNLSLYQANQTPNYWVTNRAHTPININIFDKFALKFMDGQNSKEQILDKLLAEAKAGKFTVSRENVKIEDETEVKQELLKYLDEAINRLAAQGVFE